MINQYKTLAAAAFALLLLAACSSSGGLGDIFGTGSNSGTYANQIRGTVDSVDLSSKSIWLTNVTNNNGSMLSSGGSSGRGSVRVYYDDQTRVDYQGKTYRPEDLERGDQIDVRVTQSGNNLIASSMTVVSNARTSGSGSVYPTTSTIHGTVRSVNTNSRTISIDRGYGSSVTVEYNTNTPVYYNGQTYRPADIDTGDEVDIQTQDLGSGRLLANDITVTRGAHPGTSTATSTIRGTVRSVDTYNRTIQLDSATFTGFNRNSTSGTITIQYDPNTQVDVQGQLYPISGLERGDVIEAQVDNISGSSYLARRISLVRDVRR